MIKPRLHQYVPKLFPPFSHNAFERLKNAQRGPNLRLQFKGYELLYNFTKIYIKFYPSEKAQEKAPFQGL